MCNNNLERNQEGVMTKPKKTPSAEVEWHIRLLCIILEMSADEILEAGGQIPTQEIVEKAIAQARKDRTITDNQLLILEHLCGKPGSNTAITGNRSSLKTYALAKLSGSPPFMRLLDALFGN